MLSAHLMLQVTEMWEEGECGELLIVQSLLVPRKSHMVSDRRQMGAGECEMRFLCKCVCILTVIPPPQLWGFSLAQAAHAYAFLELPMV